MADRKKIIISTGAEPDESLPTPHFDTEATLTARPVVPLGEQETYQTRYGDYAVRAQKPFWKRPAMIALIVLVAVGIGVAAGIAIGINRNRNAAETPVATAPSSDAGNGEVGQTVQTVAQPEPVPPTNDVIPEEEEEEPAIEPAKAEESKPTARNERKVDDEEVTAPPPVVRDKRREKADDDDDDVARDREDRRAEKERRREARREERRAERRGRRRDLEEEAVFPREIERAGRREANRIREIFEGNQP